MEQDIVYVCNVCNFSSANHTVVEEHMQSHSFTSRYQLPIVSLISTWVTKAYIYKENFNEHIVIGDFSALQGVSARFVEHNVHVVNYNDKAPEPASLQSAEKIWCKGNVLMLIDAYKQHEAQFATTIKKVVWQKIANVLSEKANMYKQIKDANAKSGNSPKNWEYFDYLDNILFNKPEINPVATCSIQKGLITDEHQQSCPSSPSSSVQEEPECSSRKRKRRLNSSNKKHKEKMQRQDRYLDLLERLTVAIEKRNT
ncbi:hypothetical protein FQA39_LY12544 [Lamprigera yunnana]|nr:hypothetical protein FQA39_LY12544 [Lamprigera yunnana]